MYTDHDIKSRVQEALNRDPESKLYAVNVDVIDGEAQLSGIVDTMADRERLYKIAASVPGVRHIGNGLSVSTDGPITDRGVEFEAAEELQADPRINTKHVGVEKSVQGKVFLSGLSGNRAEIEAAIEAASKARGVTDVVLQVKHDKTPYLDKLFHSQVNNDGEH